MHLLKLWVMSFTIETIIYTVICIPFLSTRSLETDVMLGMLLREGNHSLNDGMFVDAKYGELHECSARGLERAFVMFSRH